MFMFQKALNSRHLAMDFCQKGMERKWCRLAEEKARVSTERTLTAYGFPLSQVTSFKYLGQVLAAEDDKYPAVVRNLWRARQKWVRLTRILSREGVDARTLGQIYLAVAQLIMLYGSKTWVPTSCVDRLLGVFHHRVDRRLTRKQQRRVQDRG